MNWTDPPNSTRPAPIEDTDGKYDFTEGKEYRKKLLDVGLDEQTIALYEKRFQKDTTFWQRLGNFVKAENKAGRTAKIFKDIILTFVPYGRTISTASEMATEIITDKKKQDMGLIKKALSIQGVKDFFKYRDQNGKWSWEQVGISMLQVIMFVVVVYVCHLLGIPVEKVFGFLEGV